MGAEQRQSGADAHGCYAGGQLWSPPVSVVARAAFLTALSAAGDGALCCETALQLWEWENWL